jgi:hypothetical protein
MLTNLRHADFVRREATAYLLGIWDLATSPGSMLVFQAMAAFGNLRLAAAEDFDEMTDEAVIDFIELFTEGPPIEEIDQAYALAEIERLERLPSRNLEETVRLRGISAIVRRRG